MIRLASHPEAVGPRLWLRSMQHNERYIDKKSRTIVIGVPISIQRKNEKYVSMVRKCVKPMPLGGVPTIVAMPPAEHA